MPTALTYRGRLGGSALPRWRAAIAARHVAPADIVCVGDSITEGTGASARETRWLDVLQAQLRAAFPTALTPGGAGYIPAQTMADYPHGWGYAGNIAGNGTFGLGRRTAVLKSADGAIARTVFGTSVTLAWTSGSGLGTFRVLVDGTQVGSNVSTAAASATGGNRLVVSLGTRDYHTVRVEWVSGGDVYFNGLFVRDGDEARGIRVTDSGQHGSSSADWSRLTNPGTAYLLGQELAVINPALVILGLGPNDMIQNKTPASHLDNMRDIIAMIKSTAPNADILLHAAYQLAADYTYPWSSYVANLQTIAADTPGVWLLDFSKQLPRANANPYSMIAADGVHLNDTGDQFYAARFRGMLLDPHAPRSDFALDAGVVHNTGTETINGVKTFGSAPLVPVGNLLANPVRRDDARLTDARTPLAHKGTHATGGADALVPADIGAVATDDARLADRRTPLAHRSTHASNGSDPITPAAIGAAAAERAAPGFMGTFMVRDYAADPNAAGSGGASQDDTAAINAAIAAALAYKGVGGGRVVFDSGTWQTSAIIEHPELVTVEGIYNDTITYSGGAASPCVIRPLSSHPGTAIWRMRGKAETGRTYDHTGARLRGLTIDGSRTPSGTKGLLLLGLVREAEIDHVTIQDTKDTAFDFNANASNIAPQSCRLSHCLADGAGNNGYRFANVPDTTITDCNSLGATNQGFLFQGFMNGQVTNIRAEWSGQHGVLFSSGYWGTGQGSGGCIVTNITTDRNGYNGVYVDSTCKGSACIQLNGLTCRRDGRNSGNGGGSFAGLAVDSAATMPVIVDNVVTYPGVDDGGGGTLSPQFGVNAPGTSNPVVISSGYIHGATTALNIGSATLVAPSIGLATGPTASPTRVAPTQSSGGGAPAAHAASHATGGSDVLTPDAIGAVPITQRAPIGGSVANTISSSPSTFDASGPPYKRWTIQTSATIPVPTSGTQSEGQRITILMLANASSTWTVTFASGYELAQTLNSRAVTVTSTVPVEVEIECRNAANNIWRINSIDVPANNVGGAPSAHASTHATGGSDAITPASIGAVPTAQGIPAGGAANSYLRKVSATDYDEAWYSPPATVQAQSTTNATSTSTTYAAVANTGVVFVAPASGKVVIEVSAYILQATAGNAVHFAPVVLTGGTIGSGTSVVAAADVNSITSNNNQWVGTSRSLLVSGLTPGATYNAQGYMRSSSTTTATTANQRVLVIPQVA